MIGLDFKTERIADEFYERLDPRLRSIIMEQARWQWVKFNRALVITCVGRTVEENEAVGGRYNSAHLIRSDAPYVRAADVRSRNLDPEMQVKWAKRVSGVWRIRGLLHVVHHNSGSGDHFHMNINRGFALTEYQQ